MQENPYEYVHSVTMELAKLILVGTRITYQATGDAGYTAVRINIILIVLLCPRKNKYYIAVRSCCTYFEVRVLRDVHSSCSRRVLLIPIIRAVGGPKVCTSKSSDSQR